MPLQDTPCLLKRCWQIRGGMIASWQYHNACPSLCAKKMLEASTGLQHDIATRSEYSTAHKAGVAALLTTKSSTAGTELPDGRWRTLLKRLFRNQGGLVFRIEVAEREGIRTLRVVTHRNQLRAAALPTATSPHPGLQEQTTTVSFRMPLLHKKLDHVCLTFPTQGHFK